MLKIKGKLLACIIASKLAIELLTFSTMTTSQADYDAIYNYLFYHQYPDSFSKDQKRALRRKAESYKVNQGHLFFKKNRKTKDWKQVPRRNIERKRILEACHGTPEGRPSY